VPLQTWALLIERDLKQTIAQPPLLIEREKGHTKNKKRTLLIEREKGHTKNKKRTLLIERDLYFSHPHRN
jgi:hypothetical protein